MKNLTILQAAICCLSILSSCSKFQYVTIQSTLPSQAKGIVIENDSVKITYSFNGRNCPLQIHVYNKLEKPIFLDWKKSALIMNQERISFWEDKSTLNANTRGYEVKWSNRVSSNGSTTEGELFRPEQISFIPPHSFVTATPVTLKDSFFELPAASKDQKIALSKSDPTITGDKYTFSREKSPLRFRSYLTLSTNESFIPSFQFDNEFWASAIIATKAVPEEFGGTSNTQFSLKESTGFAKVMAVLIGIPLLILLAMSGAHR